jgi:hypothetical protein
MPNESTKVDRTCRHCGATFSCSPARVRIGQGIYCSRQCFWNDRPARGVLRFWSLVQKTESCWLWMGRLQPDGYGVLDIGHRMTRAHRFSYELHKGPIPDGLCVCHNCPGGDNRRCVNPDHLWLGTVGDNNRDQTVRGRRPRGERHGMARLGEGTIRLIRDRYAAGNVSQRQLAREFGISQTHVGEIVRRRIWKHV